MSSLSDGLGKNYGSQAGVSGLARFKRWYKTRNQRMRRRARGVKPRRRRSRF